MRTAEEQAIYDAIMAMGHSGSSENLAGQTAIPGAYSPFDAMTGGLAGLMTAPVKSVGRFVAETGLDAASEGILNALASSDNSGLAGIAAFPKWAKRLAKSEAIMPDGAMALYDRFAADVGKFPQHSGGSPLRSNMDYGKSFDLDTTCPRNSNCDDLIQGAAKKLERPIYADERFDAIQFLHDHGIKAPCRSCYVDTPRRAWHDGKIKLSGEYGVDPRVWDDPDFLRQQEALDPSLPEKMAEISKKSRPMMASTPKAYSEYSGQFLNLKQNDIDRYNARAGFRLNSSTDFKPEHTMDFVQAITDAKAKGLQLHGYTKEQDFIDIFGDTGIKINMSIAAEGGMKNGVPDPSSVVMDAKNGMPWDDAIKNREKYPDAGTIMVVNNEGQLLWALEQPWVDYIIPYHASGQKKSQFAQFGAEDFTKIQNPRDKATGKPVKFHRDKHQNDLETALKYAEEHGIDPQFSKYSDHPNYMKLVVDYARVDTPHKVPDPEKINYEKAEEVMGRFVENGKQSDVTDELIAKFAGMLTE